MPSGLIVSSPELCFVQMAGELPFAELVALGYELCGSYRIDKDNTDGKGFREELPLTNAAGLRSYAAKAAGLKGLNNSKQALNFIIDRSASPMETILAMMLTLPYRYGGYGFSKPQLNYRIEVPTNFGKAAGKNGLTVYYCDLYWNDKQVDVEYDSDAFHASSEQIFKDAVRRNALTKTGVTVITVSRKQIFEKESFRELAETLAKLLGKRLKCAGKDFRICQNKLRLQLLPRVGNG